MTIYDMIGIGFGPSNMAIAIALEESLTKTHPSRDPHDILNMVFIEQQQEFAWHPHMLLKDADMQISYMKDLATPRNPCSRYSFINYIHSQGRFDQFLNLKSFNPSRIEFNDYLGWAARQLGPWVASGEQVIEVSPINESHHVTLLKVVTRNAKGERKERLARNLIASIGGTPKIPDFCTQAIQDPRIFHSHHYLQKIRENSQAQRIAVIGAGQSAAEIFMDLASHQDKNVELIARTYAPKPADETPFVNKIFNKEFVEHIYHLEPDQRLAFLQEFRHANYACIDVDLLNAMNRLLYEQQVQGKERLNLCLRHQVQAITASPDHIELRLHNLNTGTSVLRRYDAVILATGYERDLHHALLKPLQPYMDDFSTDRFYRLKTRSELKPTIFVLGSNETTHGLSDTLLSLTAVRAGEVAHVLLNQLLNQEIQAA
ncbi:lysine N(6)-hydroxylase/L-ornithine N(5)-oxygenase family protein [Alcaligenes sp. SDU_A2]|uniref:lysine N(6)-hydroxylase/L-ornithine N(5)-oxygenase family protein n=1 Tax=Alcaligenes sp. SDU_A2 TaxID=3136634 RepID=UPI003120098F